MVQMKRSLVHRRVSQHGQEEYLLLTRTVCNLRIFSNFGTLVPFGRMAVKGISIYGCLLCCETKKRKSIPFTLVAPNERAESNVRWSLRWHFSSPLGQSPHLLRRTNSSVDDRPLSGLFTHFEFGGIWTRSIAGRTDSRAACFSCINDPGTFSTTVELSHESLQSLHCHPVDDLVCTPAEFSFVQIHRNELNEELDRYTTVFDFLTNTNERTKKKRSDLA